MLGLTRRAAQIDLVVARPTQAALSAQACVSSMYLLDQLAALIDALPIWAIFILLVPVVMVCALAVQKMTAGLQMKHVFKHACLRRASSLWPTCCQ